MSLLNQLPGFNTNSSFALATGSSLAITTRHVIPRIVPVLLTGTRLAATATVGTLTAPEIVTGVIVLGVAYGIYRAWHYFSDEQVREVKSKVIEKFCKDNPAHPHCKVTPPLGGQGNGVSYRVIHTAKLTAVGASGSGGVVGSEIAREQILIGPLSNFSYKYRGSSIGYRADITDKNGPTAFGTDGGGDGWWESLGLKITRFDGQLDTSGTSSTAAAKWEDFPLPDLQQTLQNLPQKDWQQIVSKMPLGGLVHKDTTFNVPAIKLGNPLAVNPVNREIKVVEPSEIDTDSIANFDLSFSSTVIPQINSNSQVIPRVGITPSILRDNISFPNSQTQTQSRTEVITTSGLKTYSPTIVQPKAWAPTVSTGITAPVTGIFASTPATVSATTTNTGSRAPTIEDKQVTTDKKIDDLAKLIPLIPLGTAAILAPQLARLPDVAQIKSAAKEATCEASQPGGCGGSGKSGFNGLLDNLGNKLDAINQAGQSAALAAINNTVNLMNTKLGNLPLVGGVTGALGSLTSFAASDRVMNLVIMAGVIHNMLMLSSSIQDTFFSILDDFVRIPQLIKDPNGEAIDTKETVTKYIDSYFKSLLGASEWTAIKAQYKAYSTIYSTAAQGFDNVRSIANDTQELMNMTRNYTAQLGNALLNEGLISEDNWEPKDEKERIKSKGINRLERFSRGLETTAEGLEAIEQVTSTLKSIVETGNEIKENVDSLNKALNDANKAAKTDREAKIEGLELPNFSLDDMF